MIQVVKVQIGVNLFRIGTVDVKYYDLIIVCDLCLYKNSHLWVRTPEIWLTKDLKKRFIYFEDRIKSDEFQRFCLDGALEISGLTLQKGIELRREFFKKTKKVTQK